MLLRSSEMSPWDGANRRGFRRRETRLSARLHLGTVTIAGVLVDLGRGGAFFETDVLVPQGALATLSVLHGRTHYPVRVVWTRAFDHDSPGLGLRFAVGVMPPELRDDLDTPAPRLASGTPPTGYDLAGAPPVAAVRAPDDRRGARRQRVMLDAFLALGELRIPGVVRDATQTGLFFETPVRVAVGQRVMVVHPQLHPARCWVVVRDGWSLGRRGLGLALDG
jgi:hypothetical protein